LVKRIDTEEPSLPIVVVAEKSSVARDIARILGATKKCDGYFEYSVYRVTWAIGHLAGIAEPHEINAECKNWNRELLNCSGYVELREGGFLVGVLEPLVFL
jgi:DNA topoisomerase IA